MASSRVGLRFLHGRGAVGESCRGVAPWLCSTRQTSAGPPPSTPSKPGSFGHKYDQFLGRYPRVYAIHRMIVDGSRWCLSDVKSFWNLRNVDVHKKEQLAKLSIPQLEILIQSPSEMLKMTSLVIVLNIPGPGDILILLLILMPRLVLTRHFWSPTQRATFFNQDIETSRNRARSLAEIDLVDSIEKLPPAHVRSLSVLHGSTFLGWPRSRLTSRFLLLRELDRRLDVGELSTEQLRFHLQLRRLASDGDNDAMRKTLRNWISAARSVDSPPEYLRLPLKRSV